LSEQRNSLKARWESEKAVVNNIRKGERGDRQAEVRGEQAEKAGDYGKVAEIRYGKIVEAEKTTE